MSTTQQVLAIEPGALNRPRRPNWHRHLHGSEFAWAIAFVVPYAAVFLAFVIYPTAYGLWMAKEPSLYGDLVADPLYVRTVVNTALFVGLGVNVKMSSPCCCPASSCVVAGGSKRCSPSIFCPGQSRRFRRSSPSTGCRSARRVSSTAFCRRCSVFASPIWFNDRWLALGSNIVAYVWKWMPFWTLTFLAGRMAIPQEIYEAADVDGAGSCRRFAHVMFPLLGSLYLVCTLLSTLWTIGDFTTVFLVSEGAPAYSTNVLATLGIHYAFDAARPSLGVAAVLSALPVLIPIVIILMRTLQTREVQL